jgi:hypothetical protein
MLAHGEQIIGPALLLLVLTFLLFAAAFKTLAASLKGKRSPLMLACAAMFILVGGWGIGFGLKSAFEDWPPDGTVFFDLILWGLLFVPGVTALAVMWRGKRSDRDR